MKKLFLSLILVFNLSSCTVYRAAYDISMNEVERPELAANRYGEYTITKNESDEKYTYEDDMISAVFYVAEKQVAFAITNKTKHTIKINWDESAYIDVNGKTSKVIHSGIRYMDKSAPQAPSVIIKGGILEDIVAPVDKIYYSDGWKTQNLFQNYDFNEAEMKSTASQYVGKSIRVLLPIIIEDVQNDYIFTFNINDAKIERTTWFQ